MHLHILNTRPEPQNKLLAHAIAAEGWENISCPTLTISYLPQHKNLEYIDLSHYDAFIFTSYHAVEGFFRWFPAYCQTQASFFAIGHATATALAYKGIQNISIASDPSSEGLIAHPDLLHIAQQKILLIKGIDGRTLLHEVLTQREAVVHVLAVYERKCPDTLKDSLMHLYHEDLPDIVLYTSASSIDHCVHALSHQNARTWLRQKPALVISQRLYRYAEENGFQQILLAKTDTIIKTIQDFEKERYGRQ